MFFYFSSLNNIIFKVSLYLAWHLTSKTLNLGIKSGYQYIFISLQIFFVLDTLCFLSPVRFTKISKYTCSLYTFWNTSPFLSHYLYANSVSWKCEIDAVKRLTERRQITQIPVLKKVLFFQRSICKESCLIARSREQANAQTEVLNTNTSISDRWILLTSDQWETRKYVDHKVCRLTDSDARSETSWEHWDEGVWGIVQKMFKSQLQICRKGKQQCPVRSPSQYSIYNKLCASLCDFKAILAWGVLPF